MNPGLRYLLRAELRGTLRRLRSRFRGPKGVVLAIGLLGLLALLVVPRLVYVWSRVRDAAMPTGTVEAARLWGGPITLLATLLLGVSARALYFKPAEVGLLFPAPVSRRELLIFHVLSRTRTQALSALWMSLFVVDLAGSWSAGLVGAFLFLSFLGLVSGLSGLLFATLSESVGTRVRQLVFVALLLFVAIVVLFGRSAAIGGRDIAGSLETIANHAVVRGLASITRPFVEVFTARDPGSLLIWTAVASGVLALAFLLLVAFDVAYEESASRTAQRVEEKLRRMRRGGTASLAGTPRRSRLQPPAPPFWGGFGPVAWRQLIELSRNARSILWFVLLGLASVLPVVWMVTRTDRQDGSGKLLVVPFAIIFMLSFTQNIAFDFRRDLDRIGWWKTVPVGANAIAAGQIFATAALIAVVQATAFLGLRALGVLESSDLVWILPPLVPLAWLLAAIDNALFLWLPYRFQPQDGGAPPVMVRVLLQMLVKMALLGVLTAIGGVLGFLLHWLFAPSVGVYALAATAYLAVACVPVTWIVGRAFERFDVARGDTPD